MNEATFYMSSNESCHVKRKSDDAIIADTYVSIYEFITIFYICFVFNNGGERGCLCISTLNLYRNHVSILLYEEIYLFFCSIVFIEIERVSIFIQSIGNIIRPWCCLKGCFLQYAALSRNPSWRQVAKGLLCRPGKNHLLRNHQDCNAYLLPVCKGV